MSLARQGSANHDHDGAKVLASILIPTHDRAATLDLSIASALAQDEPNIEVVIIGDGCSEACKAIAREFVGRDDRVRFLDLPKAPHNGAANRDRAVREASGRLIFYNDDDDLLLPHHVTTLSGALEDRDIVDTPVVSVSPSRSIHLGLHDMADRTQRELLASGTHKGVFDTHLAHTRSAYLRLGGPWTQGSERAVWSMLQVFARAQGIRWTTFNAVTALSFHGSRRLTMPSEERREELQLWWGAVEDGKLDPLTQPAGYAFHSFRMVDALQRSGLDDRHVRSLVQPTARSQPIVSSRASGSAERCLEFFLNERFDMADAACIFSELLDGRLGPIYNVRGLVQRFTQGLGRARMAGVLEYCEDSDATFLAKLAFASASGAPLGPFVAETEARFASCPRVDALAFASAAAAILSTEPTQVASAFALSRDALANAPPKPQAAPFFKQHADLAGRVGDVRAQREAERVLRAWGAQVEAR